MDGKPTDFWGKLHTDDKGTVTGWHPLVDHCADVAACCEALLNQPVLRRRIARLAGLSDIDEHQTQRLCVFAALHDVGKFNIGFQNKSDPHATLRRGHVAEVLALFRSEEYGALLGGALDIDRMAPWVVGDDGTCRILIASISHHGRPRSLEENIPFSTWKASMSRDPFYGIARLIELTKVWFPLAWKIGGTPLPDSTSLQHAFCGLVTLADWLGSDTNLFPFSQPLESGISTPLGRMDISRALASKALCAIGLDTRKSRTQLGKDRPSFKLISPYEPRPAQQLVADLPTNAEGSITILEAETGSGKTEAALARFLVLFQAGLVEGLYFALPTRTAATQIHARVVSATRSAFPDETSQPPVVLAVPGYLRVDDSEGVRLPGFEVLWDDDNRERHRGWAAESPKRYLSGAVVVGTIDQVLLSTLQVSHAHLRASALLRHLLVVDEVHASDAYMNRLLEDVLYRHAGAGGHALLMSATLGAETRARLLFPRSKGLGIITAEQAIASPYPLITHRPLGGEVMEFNPGPQRSAEVSVTCQEIASDPSAVAAIALDASSMGAKVLILRNTVRDCLETQAVLETQAAERGVSTLLFRVGDVVAPHHSRFARDDREALDLAIDAKFGKERPKGGCVAVATQTVQQSLDLDADLMITDLCPMDILLQRFGRLHRHDWKDRPAPFETPKAIVLTLIERDLSALIGRNGRAFGPHGLGTVYEDLRVLEATWRILENHPTMTIPDQNRFLVESALHSERLAMITGESWTRHANWVRADLLADRSLATLNLVDWTASFDEQRVLFSTDAPERRVQTRLGEGNRRLLFGVPFLGPFGQKIRELTLPAHLAPSAPDDAVPIDITTNSDTIGFSFGGKRYLYDRWGLRLSAEE